MLRKRVITALWGIPLLIAAIWFDEPLPWFTVLAAVWGLLAVLEFYKIVAVSRVLPLTGFGLLWTLFFILHPHFAYDFLVPLLLTSAVVLVPPLLVTVFGDSIRPRLKQLQEWLERHSHTISLVVLGVFGVVLIGLGVWNLVRR